MDKPQKKARFSKKTLVILFFVLFLAFGISLPLFMPDGADDFSGVEGIAARRALEHSRLTNGPGFIRPSLRVMAVERASTDGFCNEGLNEGDGSGGKGKTRYAVTIQETGAFGLSGERYKIHICEY